MNAHEGIEKLRSESLLLTAFEQEATIASRDVATPTRRRPEVKSPKSVRWKLGSLISRLFDGAIGGSGEARRAENADVQSRACLTLSRSELLGVVPRWEHDERVRATLARLKRQQR